MHHSINRRYPKATTLALAVLALLTACGGEDDESVVPEAARPQDARVFTPVVEATFPALTGTADTDRWTGVLGGAAYRIEVPKTGWNGKLVMWAHGYAGTGPNLTVGTPLMRRYLLANGYAWAASNSSTTSPAIRSWRSSWRTCRSRPSR